MVGPFRLDGSLNCAGAAMRLFYGLLMSGAVVLGALSNSAEARVRVDVMLGAPGPWYGRPYYSSQYYYPPAYYPPRYYSPNYYPPVYSQPPAVIVVPATPPTYIQQPEQTPDPQQNFSESRGANDWYYCVDAKAYYPYVKQCPGGWARVAPKPSGAQ
jgi:hypothetical protein